MGIAVTSTFPGGAAGTGVWPTIIEQDRAREGKLGGIGEGQRLWSTAETSVHGGDRHPVIEVRDARVHRIE